MADTLKSWIISVLNKRNRKFDYFFQCFQCKNKFYSTHEHQKLWYCFWCWFREIKFDITLKKNNKKKQQKKTTTTTYILNISFQQIGELKKENFDLKLRIYFLEERLQQKFGDEDVFKTVGSIF